MRLVSRELMIANRGRAVLCQRVELGQRLCLGEPAADLSAESERPDLGAILPRGGQLRVDRRLLAELPVGTVLLGVAVHVHRAVGHHEDDLDGSARGRRRGGARRAEVAHRLAKRGRVVGVVAFRLGALVQAVHTGCEVGEVRRAARDGGHASDVGRDLVGHDMVHAAEADHGDPACRVQQGLHNRPDGRLLVGDLLRRLTAGLIDKYHDIEEREFGVTRVQGGQRRRIAGDDPHGRRLPCRCPGHRCEQRGQHRKRHAAEKAGTP